MDQIGYPKNLIKVVVINGSISGFFMEKSFITIQIAGKQVYFINNDSNVNSIVFDDFKIITKSVYVFGDPVYDTASGGLFDIQ